MKRPSNISHPLINRTGTSQRTRIIEALNSDTAPIDGKTLADRLCIISKYAQQINYYEYIKNDIQGEYQDIDDWNSFFKNSLPFQLAVLSKTSITSIESQYDLLFQELKSNPSKQALESLLIFIDSKFITPVTVLFNTTEKENNSFAISLLTIIKSSFVEPLKTFIAVYNASATFLCITKKNFSTFLSAPWQIGVEEVYGYDACIQASKKGKEEAYLIAGESISTIFYQLLSGFQDLVSSSPDFIEESLRPIEESLQKKHQPHLGLLFTFLELFKNLQGNINDLGKKHLDFFYQQVLKIKPKKATPDKAHLVFEIAKHLDEYLLKKDVLVKNGKDVNKEDIQFGLDHEIVIDKAQITDLRTLALNKTQEGDYIEGVYIAPIANSADGLGEKFKKEQSVNWATLGSKYSKQIKEDNSIADEHPKARLGFALASSVLFLQEGKRTICISLDCRLKPIEGLTLDKVISKLKRLPKKQVLTFTQKIFEDCILNSSSDGADLSKDEIEFSTEGKKYLQGLLTQENPYTIDGNHVNAFFNVLDPNSCESIFSRTDKIKLRECLKPFYSIDNQILEKLELSDLAKKYISGFLAKQDPYILETSQFDSFIDSDNIDPNDEIKIITYLNASQTTIKISKDTLFKIQFSGEKEWLLPESASITTLVTPIATGVNFDIEIILDTDFPSIVFYDEEILKEKLDQKNNFPIVKIELNDEVFIKSDDKDVKDDFCCLEWDKSDSEELFSPYHFLRQLELVNADIDVKVCGIKNLIVQNDDNLQDVNKPISPFGPRPKVGDGWFIDGGANFYIGSKEIFCKNWQKFWINTTWKDKPADMEKAYKFYEDPELNFKFEDGSDKIINSSFRFLTSILEEGVWKKDKINRLPTGQTDEDAPEAKDLLKLFGDHDTSSNPCPKNQDDESQEDQDGNAAFCYGIDRTSMLESVYNPKSMPIDSLQPLTVNTRKGFARLTLAGVSFQHERFPFVLTKQMMALAGLVDPKTISDSLEDFKKLEELGGKVKGKIVGVIIKINTLIGVINGFSIPINLNGLAEFQNNLPSFQPIITKAGTVRGHLNNASASLDADPQDIAGAETAVGNAKSVINTLINTDLANFNTAIGILNTNINTYNGTVGQLNSDIEALKTRVAQDVATFKQSVNEKLEEILEDLSHTNPLDEEDVGALQLVLEICSLAQSLQERFGDKLEIGLPIDPYTPLIKSLSIDYEATASIDDMDIIHLYPFENTSKFEDIEKEPTLFPLIDEEGTLFIGVEKLTPGSNLSILFQLAEATANSEMDRAEIKWYYLTNNDWIELLPDFNIISDETDGLTVSGIITIAVPDSINKIGNTLMPDDLYWIKASTISDAMAVAETIGIHTQAAKTSARFSESNDRKRLSQALEAGSISKLSEGDFSVKKIEQLYPSFDGRQPEADGHFYVRVSEHLKHKGRALMLNDYEKIVLEGFPEIYKAKCISHTMGLSAIDYQRDLEIAPGFIVVTLIPDLTKLVSGNQLEPKVPVSLLEKIGGHLRKKISPFARIRIMNPRYEHVNVKISVQLYRGKSTNFYEKQLKEDITNLLAPWFLGDSEKIAFGMPVLFSDVVGFVERLDYIDFITSLELSTESGQNGAEIKPLTARSILTAGEICVIVDEEECDNNQRDIPPEEFETINESSELS